MAASMREPDHRAAPPPLQQRLEQPDQVLGLLLDLDVAVAQHPEIADALDLEAREQEVEEAGITCSSRTKRWLLAGQADEALELARQQHEADQRLGLAARSSSTTRPMPRLGMNGNGCAGSIAIGVSTASASSMEACAAATSISSSRQLADVEHLDALRRAAGRSARASSASGRAVTAADPLVDRGQLLARRHAVRADRGDRAACDQARRPATRTM